MTTQSQTTLAQKIARKEAELARLKLQERKDENGQKIILGAFLLDSAHKEPKIREWLLKNLPNYLIRPIDQKRMKPVIEELSLKKD